MNALILPAEEISGKHLGRRITIAVPMTDGREQLITAPLQRVEHKADAVHITFHAVRPVVRSAIRAIGMPPAEVFVLDRDELVALEEKHVDIDLRTQLRCTPEAVLA